MIVLRSILFLHAMLGSFFALAQIELQDWLENLEKEKIRLEEQTEILDLRIDSVKLVMIRNDLLKFGIPLIENGETPIVHPGHVLVYDDVHEQAKWTAHIASPELITGDLARIDSFIPDPLIASGTAMMIDYGRSGFDRGHLVPSADMRWDQAALQATYYYSNISPQVPELNRGQWAEMEDRIRRYVHHTERRLFIVTGPIFDEFPAILNQLHCENEVSIPKAFFKVIADLDVDTAKAIGFIMENRKLDGPSIGFAVSVDSVEKATGLDLFHALEDGLENRIEMMRDPYAWYAPNDPMRLEVEPLKAPLPNGMFNSVQAKYQIGKVATICGTVVSTRRTRKANAIYLNFDRSHPNQDFYATIWEYNGPNFSYKPEAFLLDKTICVTGKVSLYDDIPRISINNEKEVILFEEAIAR